MAEPIYDPANDALNFDDPYRVAGLSYPADLMGNANEYGGNYVIFYVNVHEDSFLIKENKVATVDGRAVPRVQSAAAGTTATGATFAALVGGGVAGAATGVGARLLAADGAPTTSVGGTVANLGVGALAAGATILAIGGAKKQYRGMKSAIALHMPTDMSVRYSSRYGTEDLSGSLAIAAVGDSAQNIGKALLSLSPSSVVSAVAGGQATASGIGYGAGLALKTPGAGQLLSKTSGVAPNPKKEQLFQDVDFRTFNFSYQFFPRSESEARNIQRIIKAFKLHMHPEYKPGTGQFLYIYPSEFDIVYYQAGRENLNLHRHTSCVLTDMQVTYTPQGQFNAFDDGMPVQINVNLTFLELAKLSKETIMQGY